MNIEQKKQLIVHLSEFVTEERLGLFQKNIKQRTGRLTIVLEDIFHSQNAEMRKCRVNV